MKIDVLGVGCAKCVSLEKNVREAVKKMGLTAEITKITDIAEMVQMGVMSTPALAIDGKIVSAGKSLSVDDIMVLLKK